MVERLWVWMRRWLWSLGWTLPPTSAVLATFSARVDEQPPNAQPSLKLPFSLDEDWPPARHHLVHASEEAQRWYCTRCGQHWRGIPATMCRGVPRYTSAMQPITAAPLVALWASGVQTSSGPCGYRCFAAGRTGRRRAP